MEEKIIKYENGDIEVLWRPEKCIHSGICVKGLRSVFDPARKKWVDVNAATFAEIAAQIDKCPSKALQYILK